MIKNTYEVVYDFRKKYLQDILNKYAQKGYKVASTMLLPYEIDPEVLYIFFTKETKNE